MKRIIALSLGDLRSVVRDAMLILMLLIPVLIAVVVNIAVPLVAKELWKHFQFDLTAHYPFLVSMQTLITPLMLGTMVGFMVLDDRDENILTYYSVTPLSKSGYLVYRMITPVMLTFVFSLLIIGLMPLTDVNVWKVWPVVFLASLEAPMVAVFMGSFAKNKVEGLTFSKGLGMILLAPIAGYIINRKWQIMFGALPPYWVSKAFLASYTMDYAYWLYLLGGLVVHMIFLRLLFSKFSRRID